MVSIQMKLDEKSEALIKSAKELRDKDIPEDPKELQAAYKEALDLSKQLEDKRKPYSDKISKIYQILPKVKRYRQMQFRDGAKGSTREELYEKEELRSSLTPIEKERQKEVEKLNEAAGRFSGLLLESYRLKPLRLKALDLGVDLPEDKVEETGFRHSGDFHSVRVNGKEYSLSPHEAKIIEVLYEEYLNGTPAVSKDYILVEADVDANGDKRLRDCFTDRDVYAALIKRDRQNYRLNI
jgi:hypothetical protein